MLLALFFLLIGFALLVKGADFLVDGATSLARRFNVSELVIGLTVIAFGTSLPELVVNVLSNLRGVGAIGFGNVIGANIADLLLVTGAAALIFPFAVKEKVASRDIPAALLAVILLTFVVRDGVISRLDGALLLVAFGVYLWILFRVPATVSKTELLPWPKTILWLFAGFLGLVSGGELVVQGASGLVRSLGVSEAMISLTVVSIGSTMPELIVSVIACVKGSSQIAIGNAVGSVIFNTLAIIGVSALVRPLAYSTSFNIELLFLFAVIFAYFAALMMGERHKMNRVEGGALLALYLIFFLFTIWKG